MNEKEPKKARRECSLNIQWINDPSNSGCLSKVGFNAANVMFVMLRLLLSMTGSRL